MTVIHNTIGVPHCWFEQSGANGDRLDVLVVRATFHFAKGSEVMKLATQQSPVEFGDIFAGPVENCPLGAVVKKDGDLVPYKPGTDIIVTGCALAPNSLPHTEWMGGIRVGPVEKQLKFSGPRELRKTYLGWDSGKAALTEKVPLDYRLAYGGHIEIPPDITPDGEQDSLAYAPNPAGCGWLPQPSEYAHLSRKVREYVAGWVRNKKILQAPQIECPERPVRYPLGDASVHGLGAIARWWHPRVKLQGKYDSEWRKHRYPLLPCNFDSRFFQSAHPALVVCPHLIGDEIVAMRGLLKNDVATRLPGWRIIAVVRRESGRHEISLPVLDTVRFDLDSEQAVLVWRGSFSYVDPIVEITLGVTNAKLTGGVHTSALASLSEVAS